MTPLVDVLIPVYKPNAAHLRAALASLMAQTETRWTALVRDDGSGADLEMFRKEFPDSRIHWTRGEQRLGIGGNWNACWTKTAAPFVQYLFQDDTWEPAYLERTLPIFRDHPEVGFVSVGHRYGVEGGMTNAPAYEELVRFKDESLQRGLHRGREFLRWWMDKGLHPNVVGEPSFVMLRRSVMERVGPFDEAMPQFLDVEYWIRMLLASDWYYLPDDLGMFRVHAAAASAVNSQTGAGIYDRLTCFERLIAHSPTPELKAAAAAARNRALDGMVRKFFTRLRSGKKVSAGGSGGGVLKKFVLHHPFLVAGAVLRALKDRG